MRRIRIIPALLGFFFLSACNENMLETQPPQGEGEVSVSLNADKRVEIVSSKAGDQSGLPNLDDFWIEIVNSKNVRFKREKYSDIKGKYIGLNSGDFTLMAKHGDSLGVGFDKPFYMAKKGFTVKPKERVDVEAVAKLANVKVAVEYGEQIRQDYSGFYTVVSHTTHEGKYLRFNANEKRAGFIPGGALSVTVYAEIDGELKCYTLKDENGDPLLIDCEPNDFVTLNVNTGISYGNLIFSVKIDDEVTVKEFTHNVPADAVDENKPVIFLSAFDEEGNYYVTEGVGEPADDVSFTFKAYAGVDECVMDIDCAYLRGLGIPSKIDFAKLSDAEIEAYEDKGFFIIPGKTGIGIIDIAGFIEGIGKNSIYNGRNTVAGSFTLTVKDEDGVVVSKTAKIIVKPDAKAVISLDNGRVWATKAVDPVVTVMKGNALKTSLQFSVDGETWTDKASVTSNPFTAGTILGLVPGKTYYLRVLYDGEFVVSDVFTFTTETAAQLGNPGFEEYQLVQTQFTPAGGALGGGTYTRNWYLPYAQGEADPWWACNSLQSMPDGHTGWTSTWCKNFPSSGYVKDSHSGSKAALLYCVNVGNTNTNGTAVGTTYEGELWIGTADGSGNMATQGHAFSSRPSKLTFWYKYSPNSSNKFFVDTWIKAADGTVIASAQETAGPAASSWTKHTLTYNYSVTDKKAALIYVRISSCYGNGNVSTGKTFTLGEEEVKAHAGSFLTLDDMELVYE